MQCTKLLSQNGRVFCIAEWHKLAVVELFTLLKKCLPWREMNRREVTIVLSSEISGIMI